MAVNRYDSPAQAEFINTYVPIPFEQLYTLGKQAKENVDKALSAYSTALDKWAEFQSPSAIDTQEYYNETYGRALPVAEEMSRNLDMLKTAEGRAKIYSIINNTDRAKLSMLRQSAENLKQRQKVNQQLMLSGKYDPEWHDVDFSNYSTLTSGIYNDVAPLAYKSVRELSDPYLKNLTPGYIKTVGAYDYYGNTREDIEDAINSNFNDIVNTPEAAKHMQTYMQRTGANAQQAEEWFRNELVDTNLDRTLRPERRINEFAKMEYANNMAMRLAKAKKGEEQATALPDVYDQTFASATIEAEQKFKNDPILRGLFSNTEVANEIASEIQNVYLPALQSGQITQEQYNRVIKDYEDRIKGLPSNEEVFKNVFRDKFYSLSGISPTTGISSSWTDSQKEDGIRRYFLGSNRLLDAISVPSDPAVENEYNRARYGDAVDLSIGNTPVKGYVVNTKDIKLDIALAASQMGVGRKGTELKVEDKNGRQRDFEDMLSAGEFGNVIMVPKNSMFTSQNVESPVLAYRNSYYVSTSAIANKLNMSESEVESYFQEKLGSDHIVKNIDSKEYSDSSTATKPRYNVGTYIRLDGNELIPNSGIRRMSFNQAGNKQYGGNTLSKEEYPSNIQQSYSGWAERERALINQMQ